VDDLNGQHATDKFGDSNFLDKERVDNFFHTNHDFDAPTECSLSENWQARIKRALKNSVLEQELTNKLLIIRF
jgi:hypothetical protein